MRGYGNATFRFDRAKGVASVHSGVFLRKLHGPAPIHTDVLVRALYVMSLFMVMDRVKTALLTTYFAVPAIYKLQVVRIIGFDQRLDEFVVQEGVRKLCCLFITRVAGNMRRCHIRVDEVR